MIRVLAREPFVAATIDTLTLWDLPLNTPAELIGFTYTLSDRYRGRLQEFGFQTQIDCRDRAIWRDVAQRSPEIARSQNFHLLHHSPFKRCDLHCDLQTAIQIARSVIAICVRSASN